jgi:hypothetical protein
MRADSVVITSGLNDKQIGFTYARKLGQSIKLASSRYGADDDGLEAECIFDIKNDQALRQEIEIHFLTINGEIFFGSIHIRRQSITCSRSVWSLEISPTLMEQEWALRVLQR